MRVFVTISLIITMWGTRVLFILFVNIVLVSSIRYETRCKLVRDLLRVGVPNDIFLGQWVCLIEKVSNRDTSLYHKSLSGKKFYGLYQIPARWCKEGRKGGECNMRCEDLLNDDIRDDTECAITIFHREGFKYWPQWTTRCKNNNLITNEIYKCPDLTSLRSSPERMMAVSHKTLRYRRSLITKSLERLNKSPIRVQR